jgi:drug/metabolite transporter (DMT)-like permease
MAADGSGGSPVGAVVLGNIFACIATLPMALPLTGIPATDWVAISYLGLFQIALAYVFVTRAVSHLPALEVSIILLVEPALNPIWSWMVHGERPGPWALVGGALIIGATGLRSLAAQRTARAPAGA